MSQLSQIINRRLMAEEVEARREQELGEAIHKDWLLSLSNVYAKYIRLWDQAESVGRSLAGPSKRWLLGAYTLLVFGSTEARHVFLTSDEAGRNRAVEAVLRDGFVENDFGSYVEVMS